MFSFKPTKLNSKSLSLLRSFDYSFGKEGWGEKLTDCFASLFYEPKTEPRSLGFSFGTSKLNSKFSSLVSVSTGACVDLYTFGCPAEKSEKCRKNVESGKKAKHM